MKDVLSTNGASKRNHESVVPSVLRFYTLGSARVECDSLLITPVEWRCTKARELLFYLLNSPGRTKEQIGLALWPDASPRQLRYGLHEVLSQLRHMLKHAEWIVYEHQRYLFNRSFPYWFDVEAFESLVKCAETVQLHAPTSAIQALEQAIDIYKGDFLENSGEWARPWRENLKHKYQAALRLLGHLYFEQGYYQHAANAYHKMVAHDPYQETGHRELMRCYARQGERSQALRHYRELVVWLRHDLGIRPSAETVELAKRLARGEEC